MKMTEVWDNKEQFGCFQFGVKIVSLCINAQLSSFETENSEKGRKAALQYDGEKNENLFCAPLWKSYSCEKLI